MRRAVSTLLLCLCASVGTRLAGQVPSVAPEEVWIGRLAIGRAWQGAYAYRNGGSMLGGTIGRAVGRRSWLRLDLSRTSFDAYIDSLSCGLLCTGTARADDRLRQWVVGLTWEERLEARGLYVLGGVAVMVATGEGLEQAGVAPGLAAGLGLRFGRIFAVEARYIQLLRRDPKERWLLPLVVSLGP